MEILETDLHAHLAPGVDDGSRSPMETVALLRGLRGLGVRRVHVTPHQFRFGNDFTVAELRGLAADVGALAERAGIAIETAAGAEYYCGPRFLRALEEGEELLTFAWSGERAVLVEFPLAQPAVGVEQIAAVLLHRGVRPVMAHPERFDPQLVGRGRLADWSAAGWRFQLNLLSLEGHHGESAREAAVGLLHEGAVAAVGSDLHRPSELGLLGRAHDRFRRLAIAEVAS